MHANWDYGFYVVFILLYVCVAVKNKATGDFFLNSHGDYPETRSVIEKGLEWQYENKNYKDSIQTNGPLKNDVVIMVSTLY